MEPDASWDGGAEPARNAPPNPEDGRPWAEDPLPVPAPSERERVPGATDARAGALALLAAHASVVSVLARRSPADFRPVPSWVAERADDVRAALSGADGLPPSLVAELAPLVTPRLERVVEHLRRRLARERTLLPLPRVREMDPACMRRNARLPGKTLIEKAGPRQQILGVVRGPRFDTMENRVLVLTSRLLAALASAEVRRPHPAGDVRARSLRRLARAATAVLARPELEGVGAPRPGERPSNALLGDADYRAVWRAGQLLKREKERFADEWAALPRVWLELVLLATWAALDGQAEGLPAWVRVADGRAGGGRVETSGPRRWIALRGDEAVVTTVDVAPGGEAVRVRRVTTGPAGVRADEQDVPASLWVGGAAEEDRGVLGVPEAAPSAARAVGLVTRVVPDGERWERPVEGAPPPDDLLGVCALDARVAVAGAGGVRFVGPSAAGHLTVSNEARMEVYGRAATWVANVAGPSTLFGARADEGGALLAAFAGRRETAVVVPDGLDELGVRQLRARMGRAWFVWSPVAAALAAVEAWPDVFYREPGLAPRHVLVVVATDAALDVAVLEETVDGAERLWVRSAPLAGDAAGREASRFDRADEARGAWLREPGAAEGWALDGDRARRVAVPAPGSVVDAAVARAARWKGPAASLVVAVGLSAEEEGALAERVGLPLLRLDGAALAHGARVFLDRRRAGLPTWKDRLPALSVEVRRGRKREQVYLVKAGTLVAPGDAIDFTPDVDFVLPAGVPRVELRMNREGQPTPYALLIEGPAFPLGAEAKVRLTLRYTYGLQGMEGVVVPVGRAAFARVPFTLEAANGSGEGATESALAETGPPPLKQRLALVSGAERALRDAVTSLDRGLSQLPNKLRKEAETTKGRADAELRPHLVAVREAAGVQDGSGPEPGPLRDWLESGAAPLLDWLLGLASSRKGRPPLLGREALQAALQARSELAVHGGGTFARWLLGASSGLSESDRLRALGRVVDGDRRTFRDLVDIPTERPAVQGDWAGAVRVALVASPRLATEGDAGAVLARVVAQLEGFVALPEVGRLAGAVRAHADLVPWLCHARPAGLAPTDASVVDAIARLRATRDALPDTVRQAGGRASTNTGDEPLAVAIDYLEGRYVALPEQR